MNNVYHIPVLLKKSIEELNINPDGIYVDLTFGGGGHSREILSHLNKGRLIAFDQDKDALLNSLDDKRFMLVNENFRYAKNFLKLYNALPADGVLADLGISSHQIDDISRGFSYKEGADLDMRMNQHDSLTAHEVVNTYSLQDLTNIFRNLGELPNAYKIAQTICQARELGSLNSTTDLVQAIDKTLDKKNYFKQLSQVFQSLRIEVNQEIEVLKDLLNQAADILKSGGRLVIISYHSLEDRLVKNFLKFGDIHGEETTKDFYGNVLRPFDPVYSKVLIPEESEIQLNLRARSAKMRVGIKR